MNARDLPWGGLARRVLALGRTDGAALTDTGFLVFPTNDPWIVHLVGDGAGPTTWIRPCAAVLFLGLPGPGLHAWVPGMQVDLFDGAGIERGTDLDAAARDIADRCAAQAAPLFERLPDRAAVSRHLKKEIARRTPYMESRMHERCLLAASTGDARTTGAIAKDLAARYRMWETKNGSVSETSKRSLAEVRRVAELTRLDPGAAVAERAAVAAENAASLGLTEIGPFERGEPVKARRWW